jgi:uncharacterized membrane protein YfcA
VSGRLRSGLSTFFACGINPGWQAAPDRGNDRACSLTARIAMNWLILALITGAVAGLLGALCGVGGGIVMVPAFVAWMGLDHKQAIVTSLAVIMVTALAATVNHARAGTWIDWRLVAAVGAASAVAAWFGSDLMRSLSNQTLARLFGCVLIAFGIRMLWKGGA